MPNPTDEEVASLLEKAADLLESGTLRWIQGDLTKGSNTACAVGAICYADYDTFYSNSNITNWAHELVNVKLMRKAPNKLTLPRWNDQIGRTVDEVVDLLKETAKDIRNGELTTERHF